MSKSENIIKEIDNQAAEPEFVERVIFINRCAKVVKGGRRFSFSAIVVVGDGRGNVGLGFGKGNEVALSIKKAINEAKKKMEPVALKDSTITHEVTGKYKAARVLLKPAHPGTGVIAGGGVRAVCEAAGIKDVLSKCLGSSNVINNVKAALQGLRSLRSDRLRD